jgi:hypothetical protein
VLQSHEGPRSRWIVHGKRLYKSTKVTWNDLRNYPLFLAGCHTTTI